MRCAVTRVAADGEAGTGYQYALEGVDQIDPLQRNAARTQLASPSGPGFCHPVEVVFAGCPRR
eukprot:1578842-Prymnesium_polylepis.2